MEREKMDGETVRTLDTGLKEILKDHEKFEQLAELDRLPFSEIPIYLAS